MFELLFQAKLHQEFVPTVLSKQKIQTICDEESDTYDRYHLARPPNVFSGRNNAEEYNEPSGKILSQEEETFNESAYENNDESVVGKVLFHDDEHLIVSWQAE